MNKAIRQKYSVIVPSFNRADEIADLIDSVRQLSFDHNRFELIIVDDGSTDGTLQLLSDLKTKPGALLNFHTQRNQGPGAARNTGMSKAGGDFFIFIDSDCTVPPTWLAEIDRALQESQADAFGGPDTYAENFPALLKAINYTMTSFITTGGLRGKKGKKLAKFYPRSFNMGLSRSLQEKIGGFGSLRHGQDIEFSHRIIQSGAKVIFIATAPVFHKRRTNIRRFYKQVFNWGVARINLYMIDRRMLEPLHTLPAAVTGLALIIIILAFFTEPARAMLVIGLVIAALILLVSMIDALRLYRQIKPALLLPLIMPAQIFGYGLGFIFNYLRRVIFKMPEKVGFKKHYYK
jgi:glycosyltransferase involved in cell wall biosynthesis